MIEFSLLDMTPYSREVYLATIAHYNQAIWPAQLIAGLLALWLAYACMGRKVRHYRLVLILMAASWFWCGGFFLIGHYSDINWSGEWFGYLFMLQGVVLLLLGVKESDSMWLDLGGREWRFQQLPWLTVLLLYPLSLWFEGRAVNQWELFGLFPGPTLMATLVLSLRMRGLYRTLPMVLPLPWALASVGFALPLGLIEPYLLLTLIAVWVMRDPLRRWSRNEK